MRLATIMMMAIAFVSTKAHAQHPAGWLEQDSTTIEALLPTLGDGQLLVVEVSADWCVPCHQLHNEVLATALAQQIIDDDVGITLDFESAYGQEVKKKHGVLGIPTTIVFDRTGAELGRIEGYAGAKEYVDALHEAKAGRLGLAAMEAKVKAEPKDVNAKIDLAQAHLQQGKEPLGLRELSQIMKTAPLDEAARAARIKGRWLLRVKDDGPAAIVHFHKMFDRFKGTAHENQFRYWYAAALVRVGSPEQGLALFDEVIARDPNIYGPMLTKADFMVQSGMKPDVTEPYVRKILEIAPDDAQVHYLLSRILEKRGDLAGAKVEADEALRLEPQTPIYQNRATQLAREVRPAP